MRAFENRYPICKSFLAAVIAMTLAVSSGAQAAGKHSGGHGHGHGPDIGKPGKASAVSRTITVTLVDNRYSPEKIDIRKGETVRFVLKNEGEFVHEFNIGTAQMHKAHQKEMMMMVEHGVLEPDRINRARMKMDMGGGKTMEHDDPNSVLLEPRKSAEIIWQFDTDATLEFACNIPGHYESGMVGTFSIR